MSEPRSGQVVAGKYRVRRCLGSGGMGAVYEAENLTTGKRVALKWLHPHLVNEPGHSERFMREAMVLAKIRHPNVVDLYDVGRDQDSFFLVLEFLEGESLGELLDRGMGPIPETISLLVDAMRGVAAAHKQGIIHRDLKPDNIFLARENDDGSLTPKLLDFGISKFALPDSAQLKLTKTGSIFGTPRYMSFEQLMGTDVDARADVYSFGVILYEALTGQAPYPASNFHQLIVQFGALNPAPPRQLRAEIPRELERVIMSALSRERDKRPPSMDALIKLISPFRKPMVDTRGFAQPERKPAPPTRELAPARRTSWKPALAVVAMMCTSAAVGWMFSDEEPPRLPPVLPTQSVSRPVAEVVSEPVAPPAPPAVEQVDASAAALPPAAPTITPAPASVARLTPAPKPRPLTHAPAQSAVQAAMQAPAAAPAPSPAEQPRRRTPGMSAEQF